MTSLDLAEELTLALELMELADRLSMRRYRALDLSVDTKPDRTPVTEADRAIETALREELSRAHPDHAVIGEEHGATGAPGAIDRWIIDPIDGTKNYLRGVPVWGTLLGLEHRGEFVLGVVSAPALQRRWWATQGNG